MTPTPAPISRSLFFFSIFYGGMVCIAGVLGNKQVALGPLAGLGPMVGLGPLAGGSGHLCLPAAGDHFQRGRRTARARGRDPAGSDRLPAADRVDPAVHRRAGGAGGERHGPQAGRSLCHDDGGHAAHLGGRDRRLRHFADAQRHAVRRVEGARGAAGCCGCARRWRACCRRSWTRCCSSASPSTASFPSANCCWGQMLAKVVLSALLVPPIIYLLVALGRRLDGVNATAK